jgi:hypothetical protein
MTTLIFIGIALVAIIMLAAMLYVWMDGEE